MPALHLIHSEQGLSEALDVATSGDYVLILYTDGLDPMPILADFEWSWLRTENEDKDSHCISVDDMVILCTQYKPILTWP